MLPLAKYDMSRARGFLCQYDAGAVSLPTAFDEVVQIAESLPDLLVSGRVRHFLDAMPVVSADEALADADDRQWRAAMVRYSFLIQAYVWGEPEAPKSVPASIAVPIWQISEKIGQPPLLPYSSYVLDNWKLLDPEGEIALDNVAMIQNFLAGMDEAWFVLVHVAIEAAAGEVLDGFAGLMQAAEDRDGTALGKRFADMMPVWDRINAIFDRMPERCDPYMYFNRVRPYIHGWKDNPALPDGLLYEGVEAVSGKPQAFRGQTGSQSSIVPSMDALLGIGHKDDPMRRYLDELHIYRPPAHRRFIDDVRKESKVRDAVRELEDASLIEAYNGVVEQVARFRTKHLEYAASYINKQASAATGNDTEVGTGGTPFMKYLKKHRDECREQFL